MHTQIDDVIIAQIADEALADRRSVVRRLARLPVRGRVASRIDAAIARHGLSQSEAPPQ
jgi:hypothetical protein